jgi:hypothetical protein
VILVSYRRVVAILSINTSTDNMSTCLNLSTEEFRLLKTIAELLDGDARSKGCDIYTTLTVWEIPF